MDKNQEKNYKTESMDGKKTERDRNAEKDRNENIIEGRNAVLEAFRSGKTIDKLLILNGCQDGPVKSIIREAKKQDTLIQYVEKERLNQLGGTGKHQGVIAYAAACAYAEVETLFWSCWIILKTLTIWAPLSVRRIWREPMELSFPRDGL